MQPRLTASLSGAGSPNYLGRPAGLFVLGRYIFVTTSGDDSLSIFETNIGIKASSDSDVSSLRKWLRIHNPYSV